MTLKGYTKGEHVLRFEAIVHNTKTLRTGRTLERLPDIVVRLANMVDRFTTMLDCVDVGFLDDGLLDSLPQPAQLGPSRVGGIDLNKARTRAVLAGVLALAVAPEGFTAGQLAVKVHAITGQPYTARQASYDLRKLRSKQLAVKPDRSHRYQVPPDAARTLTALSVLRDQVLVPILAGIRARRGRKPQTWTRIDDHYQTLRQDMTHLFEASA